MTDGFLIVMGSWVVNLAAFLTMLTAVWNSPEYDDKDRQAEAETIFFCLLVQHVAFAVIKYVTLYHSEIFEKWSTILVILQLVLMCYILRDWVYYVDADK